MAKVTGRRVVSAAVLAVSVGVSAVGCGQEGGPVGAPPVASSPGVPGSSAASEPSGWSGPAGPSGSPAAGTAQGVWRPVYFSVSDHVPGGVHEVVRDRAAMGALLDRFGARDADAARAIGAATRAADFSRSVVVVWADVTGCSAATSVVLQVAGDRLQLAVTRPEPPPECFAPDRMTAVFEVPRGQVPGAPEFRLVGQR